MEMLLQGNALLALGAALLWGGGDFSGGMAVKRAGGSMLAALRVILLSHSVSLGVLLLAVWWRGDPFPHGAALGWGLMGGMTAGIALACFYVALSRGAMGASAALSGLLAAAIPAAVSIGTEGSPGLLRIAGFVVAGMAIWLIAAGPNPEATAADRGTVWLAVVAGVGFGIYFVALKFAGSAGVIWPLATCRMGSLTVCSLLVAWMSRKTKAAVEPMRLTRTVVGWAMGAVLLDTPGICCLSRRRGRDGWMLRRCWLRFIRLRRFCWRRGCCGSGLLGGRGWVWRLRWRLW